MNNEIGRKITSLTLMAIMVAGGLTFAVPGVMPAAHAANANLFVSAENSQFDNYMSGPQVIEVVIIDSDINDTDEAKGEPDVTVNGKILRMVQAVDGNWYGYFADMDQAQIADSVVAVAGGNGTGIDFGDFCTAASAGTTILADASGFTDTEGVAMPASGMGENGVGSSSGGVITNDCTLANGFAANGTNNVVREYKTVNTSVSTTGSIGQIGLSMTTLGHSVVSAVSTGDLNGLWPFIQLYDLNPTGNVVVQYNKGGGVQSTTLTFDTVENYANLELDRSVYPQGAQVHATITDLWLNIDPTDEDSWTFGTLSTNQTTFYQLFDENGAVDGDNVDSGDLTSVLDDLMCEDNCKLAFTPDAQGTDVVTIQDNGDSVILAASATNPDAARTNAIAAGDRPITITEQGPNSGVFGTYDESDNSALKVISTADRGKSATLDYNEDPITILVGHSFATVDIQPIDDEWSSGEEIPVVIVDGDANKNSRADEDLDVKDPDVSLIPSLATGDPFTLGENTTSLDALYMVEADVSDDTHNVGSVGYFSGMGGANATGEITVDSYSMRGVSDPGATAASTEYLLVDLETTLAELQSTIKDTRSTASDRLYGVNLFNYDIRSVGTFDSLDIYLVNSTVPILVENDSVHGETTQVNTILIAEDETSSQGLVSLNNTNTLAALFDGTDTNAASAQYLGLLFSWNASSTGTVSVADSDANNPIVADFFSFGFTDDGVQSSERVANQIVRIEAEESGDNTSTFEGTLEYVMVNQINIQDATTFTGITTIADDPSFIVIEDLTDEDAPRVNYNDLGADGVITPVSDQEEAPSHSGVVSFNQDSYKIADTVVITLEDLDLNVDSDLIDIFTVATVRGDDAVGSAQSQNLSFGELGRMLDVTFDDIAWSNQSA